MVGLRVHIPANAGSTPVPAPICPLSSVGSSNRLLSDGSLVRVQQEAPCCVWFEIMRHSLKSLVVSVIHTQADKVLNGGVPVSIGTEGQDKRVGAPNSVIMGNISN